MQVTTKDVKKEDRLSMKSPPSEVECEKGVFQIQAPVSGVNFSDNMSIPKARVNTSETEHDTTFETSQILKSDSHLPKKSISIWYDESSLKLMEIAFYFILKALFFLKIFKFLYWHFGHVEETA